VFFAYKLPTVRHFLFFTGVTHPLPLSCSPNIPNTCVQAWRQGRGHAREPRPALAAWPFARASRPSAHTCASIANMHVQHACAWAGRCAEGMHHRPDQHSRMHYRALHSCATHARPPSRTDVAAHFDIRSIRYCSTTMLHVTSTHAATASAALGHIRWR
jgi:hypothetical protein